MKYLFLLLLSTALMAATCQHRKALPDGCFKGRLEIQAACMNYTIRVVDGNMDTSLIAATWTDESTGKSYKNVFELGSKCNFPDSIDGGEEFYFTIDTLTPQQCAVCLMYYPVPPKRLSIKVLSGACSQ